jgi:hypothetical protein
MKEAGVPAEQAAGVARLANALGVSFPAEDEPLCDPLTLLRFHNSREGNMEAAAEMYKQSVLWRDTFSMCDIMAANGVGENYNVDGPKAGMRSPGDVTQWNWVRSRQGLKIGSDAELAQHYGFWGRLEEPHPDTGAPVAVWRIGSFDIAGVCQENLNARIQKSFVAHLEDLLQASRAISSQQGQLRRCHLIVDAHGVGTHLLYHKDALRKIFEHGKFYFPEVNATVTIIRAPSAFTTLWVIAKRSLTEVMKRKVQVLGEDFAEGMLEHSRVPVAALPTFLGGTTSPDQVGEAQKIPLNFSSQTSAGV